MLIRPLRKQLKDTLQSYTYLFRDWRLRSPKPAPWLQFNPAALDVIWVFFSLEVSKRTPNKLNTCNCGFIAKEAKASAGLLTSCLIINTVLIQKNLIGLIISGVKSGVHFMLMSYWLVSAALRV